MADLEDTRPKSPFKEAGIDPRQAQNPQYHPQQPPINAQPPQPPYPQEPSGPGCLVWGLILICGGLMSVAVVFFAGTAGWTAGEQEANRLATVTQVSRIGAQLTRIPQDIVEGNDFNLGRRLDYLETVVPGYGELPALRETATALYLVNLPTATATSTVTPTPTPTLTVPPPTEMLETAEVTEVIAPPTEETEGEQSEAAPGNPFNLDPVVLLEEARTQIANAEYDEAYETLDIIIRLDDDFQRETVRGLMYEALTTRARQLYRAEATLAEAITLTDLAEEYGPVGESELNYERLIASLYLDAQRNIGSGDHLAAIGAIQQLLSYQTSYLNQDFTRLLFEEYVAYAEAWAAGQEYCQAVVQYQNALNLFNDPLVVTARDAAQQSCAAGGALTGTPGVPGAVPGATLPPIGQPGT